MPTFVNDANGNTPLFYLAVTLTNNQVAATGTNFPAYITINSNNYTIYEAANLINLNWQDGANNILSSWLESGETNTSTSTVYWVKLPNSIAGSGGTQTIYLVFYGLGATSKDSSVTGAEPKYTGTYAQYDSGANVFAFYDNFKGNTDANFGAISAGTVAYNNGATISWSGAGAGNMVTTAAKSGLIFEEMAASASGGGFVGDNGLDSGNHTNNGYGMYYHVNGADTGLQILNNGTTLTTGTGSPQTNPAIVTFAWPSNGHQAGYISYSTNAIAATDATYTPGATNFVSIGWISGSVTGNYVLTWVRTRTPPPSYATADTNVNTRMPTISLGSVTSLGGGPLWF